METFFIAERKKQEFREKTSQDIASKRRAFPPIILEPLRHRETREKNLKIPPKVWRGQRSWNIRQQETRNAKGQERTSRPDCAESNFGASSENAGDIESSKVPSRTGRSHQETVYIGHVWEAREIKYPRCWNIHLVKLKKPRGEMIAVP